MNKLETDSGVIIGGCNPSNLKKNSQTHHSNTLVQSEWERNVNQSNQIISYPSQVVKFQTYNLNDLQQMQHVQSKNEKDFDFDDDKSEEEELEN